MRWFVLILLIGLIVGCSSKVSEDTNKSYIENEDINKLKVQVIDLKEERDALKKQVEELSEKVGGLERQDKIAEEQETEAEPVSSTIDLTSWKRDDIVKIMAKYDTDFTYSKWFTFIYREDKHYYDQVGPIFGEDLFYDIRYKDRGDELTVNRFRMFNLGSGNKTIATGVYENDYLPLISKAQLINSDLVCVNEI